MSSAANIKGDLARMSFEELTALAIHQCIADAINRSGYRGDEITADEVKCGLDGLTPESAGQLVAALKSSATSAESERLKQAIGYFDAAEKVFSELLEIDTLPDERRRNYESKRKVARDMLEHSKTQISKFSKTQAFKFQGTY